MTKKLTELYETLQGCGVKRPGYLCVFQVLGDQIVGEVSGEDDENTIVGKRVFIENPKRFMRLQQMSPEGMKISFLLGDLDFMEKGRMEIIATSGYYICDMDQKSQISFLEFYLNFIDRKRIDSARAAGIEIPDMGNNPFVKAPRR